MPHFRQHESGTYRGPRRGRSRAAFPVRKRLASWVIALALVCAARESPAQPTRPGISLEYAVKATYLYKLAPFVNWPPDTFTAANQPFRICVAGEDPFGDYLQRAVAGRALGTHPFMVRHLETVTPDSGCQVIFISHLRSQSLSQALNAVRGEPVLTVTDSTADPDSGSIMQFVIDNGRVRFDVNTGEAARNHLSISSKLLNLALAVRDEH
jgi:hypothetical protein